VPPRAVVATASPVFASVSPLVPQIDPRLRGKALLALAANRSRIPITT
jgi:hypothetical protein